MRSVSLHLIQIFIVLLIIFFGSLCFYSAKYSGRIYPNIYVAGINISGLTPTQANEVLSQKINMPYKITLTEGDQTTDINTKEIDLSYDMANSVNRAFDFVRTGNPVYDWTTRLKLLTHKVTLGLSTQINEDKLTKIISIVSGVYSVEPLQPSLKIANGVIQINKGSPGSDVNQNLLRARIGQNLSLLNNGGIEIPVLVNDPSLTDVEVQTLKNRTEKLVGKNFQIKFEYQIFTYTDTDIIKFINPKGSFDDQAITNAVSKIASLINRDPQNPKFTFSNNRVTEFVPATNGVVLDNEKLKGEITDILNQFENTDIRTFSIDAPVAQTPPEVTTDKVNDLGIKELIGRGTSNYFHSIPGRVHNVVLAASRINGTLVKPGETFSFNDTLGDVSQFTGYQQAYIISDGKTILGDGGGVCQVSTTLFRALLNAGLPITERAAHAYRVGYYEQNSAPGLDATVYGPSPDLKFVNDTPNYVLIEAQTDPVHYSLVFELYGTNDGRVATISKPIVSNISPALPTVYQDDPTLRAGTLKQIDFSAAGARVSFNYNVVKNGATITQKTFVSNYRPWAAVYLRGTAR